jgi:hypothetical protein
MDWGQFWQGILSNAIGGIIAGLLVLGVSLALQRRQARVSPKRDGGIASGRRTYVPRTKGNIFAQRWSNSSLLIAALGVLTIVTGVVLEIILLLSTHGSGR